MLLENEGEILAMTETVTGTYEGISPVIVDNDNSTISLEQSAKEALDCVVTNSATWNDASGGNGGYYSKYQPYGLNAISGNLVIEGSRYPRQTFIGVSSDNSASTAGIIPPVPEQNLTAERYLVAASGSLADVSWKEIPNFDDIQTNSATWNEVSSKLDTTSFSTVSGDFYPYSNPSGFITGVDLSDYYTKNETSGADELANAFNNIPAGDEEVNNTVHTYSGDWNSTYTTVHSNSASWAQGGSFTGVTTDATLTGDGLNNPLGVADTQTLSSDQSISITTAVNGVILGVNSSWFDNAVNSAVTGTQGDAEVNAAVHNNSATWSTVTNKLDSTAFSTVSGTFLTAHQDLSNYVTETDLESTSATITSMIPSTAGLATETDLQIVSAGVDYISGVALTSVDLTPYLTTATYAADSGTFATTSMLNDYQTTAGMTAYASTGDISGTQWNSVYETVETNSASWAGGGTTYTGDAQGALDTVYAISAGIISGTRDTNWNFTANNITSFKVSNVLIGDDYININYVGHPNYNWSLNSNNLILGPALQYSTLENYERVYLTHNGLSAMSGFRTNPVLLWKSILNTDLEGTNNTITGINGSAIGTSYTPTYHGIEI